MNKKIISFLTALILLVTTLAPFGAYASQIKEIKKASELEAAFASNEDATYILANDINPTNMGIKTDTILDGNGYTMRSMEKGNGATIYQNDYAHSQFRNVKIKGNTKGDVGIWISTGIMSFTDSFVFDFNISTINQSAFALGYNGVLTLNNTQLYNNTVYDVALSEISTLNINEGTSLNKVHLKSQFAKINIGDNWSGEFELTIDSPVLKAIGTVGNNADISKINVTNKGYSLENRNGQLYVICENERAIRFDLSKREKLYKGSTGFLYGAAEINVPSIDLLQGLKPDTMVQKALGGLQHPTGDATRTKSSLLCAGVKDMQIYFQDMYLEWPYDAPMKNGTIDIDSYQKSVEKIVYAMICDKSSKGTSDSFLGTDGNYYVLNKENASKYSYVLFNEPDQIWFGGNLQGLEKAWNQLYEAVHKIDPDARCVGPNYSGFNSNDYKNFIEYCYNNNCLPEIISWHELGDISLTDFYTHYDYVQKLVETYYKDSTYQPQLMVNEYARHYDIGSPGGLIKWLSMFEDKDMSACMAYWAMANSLNELAADQNSPSSSWWVYHWYAQMTGDQCPLVSPAFDETRFYGLCSYDESINMGYALFGGSEDINGDEVIYLDNLSDTDLTNSKGMVNVKLYSVSFSGQHGANYKPDCIFDGAVISDNNSLRLQLNNTDEMEAYFAVLTKADEDADISDSTDLRAPALSYEAENATLLGNATAYQKYRWYEFATSGRADVGNILNNGDGVQFDIGIEEDGIYTASLFYSLQSPYVNPNTLTPDNNGQNRGIGKTLPYAITVDGVRLDDIYLESTISWLYKNHCDVDIELTAGHHTITYTHINGNQSNKGNLQLTAAIDKLDIKKLDSLEEKNDFEICLDEMTNFKSGDTYRLTAIAPISGYYTITADGDCSFAKQTIDYASDAKTYSEISTYDIPVGATVYLSKGANTIVAEGFATKLCFTYEDDMTEEAKTVISADEMTLHGNNPVYKVNTYAESGKVISEIGVGQKPINNDTGSRNYVSFKINADTDGYYNLAIRYSNDEPAPVMLKSDNTTYIHPYNIDLVERFAQISVNGNEPETVYFRNTMSWDTFKTVDIQVKLTEGINTIKIYNDNSYQFSELVNSTAPEIDNIAIAKLTYDNTKVTKTAKTADTKHKYTKVVSTTKATLTKSGKTVTKYTCTECGYSYSQTTAIYSPKTITLSATVYNYDGKVKTPTVTVKDSKGKALKKGTDYTVTYASGRKLIGKYAVKITFKGNYSGTKTLYFTIRPKNTTFSLASGKKAFTAKIKKYTTQTTGYQIQYSTNSKFTSAKTVSMKNTTTSKTISKLAGGKKYYVRVRTYKTVKINGKNTNIYSAWSSAKAVTTKK